MAIAHYTCPDGTPFPVEWHLPGAEHFSWRWNQDHVPGPMQPLAADIKVMGDEGRQRAFAEAKMEPPWMFRGFEVHHGFHYVRVSPPPPPEMMAMFEKNVQAASEFGGVRRMWLEFARPRMEVGCAALRAAPISTPTRELAELWQYTFFQSMTAGPAALIPLNREMAMILTPLLGNGAAVASQDLWGGEENPTLEASRAVWQMAQLASGRPELLSLVARADRAAVSEMLALENGDPFRLAFEQYVETYCWRTDEWHASSPTLGEQPETLFRRIAEAMAQTRTPDEVQREALARTAELRARIEGLLADRPEAVGRFRKLLAAQDGYVMVREDRALWQLNTHGSLRAALLKKGEALAAMGRIARPDDVMFLRATEVDDAIRQAAPPLALSDVVEKRRAEWTMWRGRTPPVRIGAPLPPGAIDMFGSPPRRVEDPPSLLRGNAASHGTVTAPARVVTSLDESHDFEPGHVLVCVMTSPPWTPLFALASAVVTDAGMAGSHPAIIAREFGIPAVVGCAGATEAIPNGATITVDGDAGTVTIH